MMLAGEVPDVCTLGAWALYKMWREREG
jgi:hypothetical protein